MLQFIFSLIFFTDIIYSYHHTDLVVFACQSCCDAGLHPCACRFISALTRGGPNGMPRPIEMNAHDPRRYLGDMLAWLHQGLASERELLISLFGQDDPSRAGDQSNGHSEVPSSSALLDRVVEGVCRPLKVGSLRIALNNLALSGGASA